MVKTLLKAAIVFAILFIVADAFSHTWADDSRDVGTSTFRPNGAGGLSAWIAEPITGAIWEAIDEASANDADFAFKTGGLNNQQFDVDVATQVFDFSVVRIDSLKMFIRTTNSAAGAINLQCILDTNGTDIPFDTVASGTSNSWVNRTTKKFVPTGGMSQTALDNIEIGVKNLDAGGVTDTCKISQMYLSVYHSSFNCRHLIFHDSADFMMATISNTESRDDIWVDANLTGGKRVNDTCRIIIGIKKPDTLKTNGYGCDGLSLGSHCFRTLDSARLDIMCSTAVDVPGYIEFWEPAALDTSGTQKAINTAPGNDNANCHSDWDHWYASAEGATQSCGDTVLWGDAGIDGVGDRRASNIDTTTLPSGAVKRIDVTDWVRQMYNAAAGSKWPYNGLMLTWPRAESTTVSRQDTLYANADGDLFQWTASAGADFECVDETTPNDNTDYISTSTLNNQTFVDLSVDTSLIVGEIDSVRILTRGCNLDVAENEIDLKVQLNFDTAGTDAILDTFTMAWGASCVWASKTSRASTAIKKRHLPNLELGVKLITTPGVLQSARITWLVAQIFWSPEPYVRIGNVQPMAGSDSTCLHIYYSDVTCGVDAHPGIGASEKVWIGNDTSEIFVGGLDSAASLTAQDGTIGRNSYRIGRGTSTTRSIAALGLTDTAIISTEFPKNQYVIDSAKWYIYILAETRFNWAMANALGRGLDSDSLVPFGYVPDRTVPRISTHSSSVRCHSEGSGTTTARGRVHDPGASCTDFGGGDKLWLIRGATDSTQASRPDHIDATIDTLGDEETTVSTYCSTLVVTTWADSMRNTAHLWGNAIRVKGWNSSSNTGWIDIANCFPINSNPDQATFLAVWGTDTTTAASGRRRRLIPYYDGCVPAPMLRASQRYFCADHWARIKE